MSCPEGFYNLERGSQCKRCPVRGAVCSSSRGSKVSGGGVSAQRGFYGYFDWKKSTSELNLQMLECPPHQCCEFDNCLINGTTECPPSRNSSTPMCGSCLGTKSETFGSIECKDCAGQYWLVLIAVLVVLCCLGCYLHSSAKSSMQWAEVPISQIVITKNLAYFYQALPLV